MKKRKGPLVAALIAFLAVVVLATCGGGGFVDPGTGEYLGVNGAGGGTGGGGFVDPGAAGYGGAGGGGGRIPSTKGRLTINGLDEVNGKYVYATTAFDSTITENSFVGRELYMADSLTGNASAPSIYLGTVRDGSVTLKVWEINFDVSFSNPNAAKVSIKGYSGNDTISWMGFGIIISNKRSLSAADMQQYETMAYGQIPSWLHGVAILESSVQFVNGIGSGTADTFTYENGGGPIIPDPSNATPLSSGQWANGNFTSNGKHYYSFNVTAGTTYYFWINDEWEGDGTKTLDVYVDAYYENGDDVFDAADSAWDYPKEFTAESTGKVIVEVYPYWFSSGTGTYAIAYNTSGNRP